ncbi:MAG: PhoH family protein [Bdellovibrionota bacterium]
MSDKIFVIDTSVILHDHNVITHFKDQYVAIPIAVLEELDNFKKGNDTKSYSAREFIRFIDKISEASMLQNWVPIGKDCKGFFKVVYPRVKKVNAEIVFDDDKNDHKILNAALTLQESENKKVVLITKDIALRVKARALDITAEDYEQGKIKDVEMLDTGKNIVELDEPTLIEKIFEDGYLEEKDITFRPLEVNNFYILKYGKQSALTFYNCNKRILEKVLKKAVYRIEPRNAEQIFAIDALLRPDIPLVALQGVAGTGKTLLALASALEQRRDFKQVFVARPVVPLGNKDMGFLPGDIKSKITPYMEPLWDNLRYIKSQFSDSSKESSKIDELIRTEKIEIAPLSYIRGRSLSNVIFIVDEAQNLTPHEVKTIITRAGDNTKIIFTGDIHQIDTPYLDALSNGLSFLIDRLRGNRLFAHIKLEKGERSELANLANELL